MYFNRKLIKYLNYKYPDWDVSVALRYLPIAKDIERSFKKKSSILDVGSGQFGLNTYLKNYDITGTDIVPGDNNVKSKVVLASAEKLPFENNSFDVVVSVDMVEHLRPSIRKKAIDEMVRVGRQKLYISFPRGKLSAIVDSLIARYYKLTHKEDLEFLLEHKKYGLPNDIKTFKDIKISAKKFSKSVSVKRSGNTNLLLWIILLIMGFSENKYLTNIYHKLLLFLPILNVFHFWPTYRTLLTVEINESKNE
jgi:hypothetical protein